MTHTPNRASLILGLVLAATFANAATAQPDATVLLSGFGDFSGAETQLVFDDLGLVNGNDVASVAGVDFELSAGGPAKFFEDAFPRELGPAGAGSVNNFWGFTSPYPDLDFLFAGPVHRVGFELRANVADDVAVALFSNGVLVEEMVVPSRGSDAFYFYGYENAAGFDEVRVDVVDNASGAFSLDNLTFESLGVEEPPEDPEAVPGLACEGFKSFPHAGSRRHHHRDSFRMLLAKLTDETGSVVGPDELAAPPAVRVLFTPVGSEESLDVTAEVAWAGYEHFTPTRRGQWLAWLSTRHMQEPGAYLTLLESGDPSTYEVDPVCADWTWVEPPRPRHHRKHHRHHRHHHGDR